MDVMNFEVSHPGTGEVLTLADGMPIEDWTEYGRSLFAVEKQISWKIADWWAFGESKYGERAKLAVEGVFGKSFQTLQNAGSTARAFPEAYRQREVPFSHHAEVAALARVDPEAAATILQHAADQGSTKMEVREEVRLIREPDSMPAARPDPVPEPELFAAEPVPLTDEQHVRRIVSYWNRASDAAREEVRLLAEDANWGIITL